MRSEDQFSWTDQAVEILKRLHAEGKSGTEIAEHLSRTFRKKLTRNAVIGKKHRLGLQKGAASSPGGYPKGRRRKVSEAELRRREERKAKARERQAMKQAQTAQKLARDLKKDRKLREDVGRVDLIDLEPGQCKWPTREVAGTHLFCGSPVHSGSPYCASHHARAYVGAKGRADALDTPPPPGCREQVWTLAMEAYATGATATAAARVCVAGGYPMTAYLLARRVAEFRDKAAENES